MSSPDNESLHFEDILSPESASPAADADTPKLGVLQLNYHYPTLKGDIDCADSYNYEVIYRPVKSLCFEACKKGELTEEMKFDLEEAVLELKAQGVSGIAGSCGFMIHF